LENIKELPSQFAGIVGLDANKKGEIIGTKIPPQLESCKLFELYQKYSVKGDKKLVFRTEIIKKIPPYPLFEGERFVPLDYKYLLIDQEYTLKPVNEIFCIVEYQSDGSTQNIFKQYKLNPRGFAFSRISRIQLATNYKELVKNTIHLVSSCLFLKEYDNLKVIKKPFLVLFAIPFGLLLHVYILYKIKE
jgi:hypothetical protein